MKSVEVLSHLIRAPLEWALGIGTRRRERRMEDEDRYPSAAVARARLDAEKAASRSRVSPEGRRRTEDEKDTVAVLRGLVHEARVDDLTARNNAQEEE